MFLSSPSVSKSEKQHHEFNQIHQRIQRASKSKQQVEEENYQAIYSFINEVAAEGIGESQQERQIYSLKTVIKKLSPHGFKLEAATKAELKNVLAQINRSDYAESTKAKFRASLKKFYKIQNGGDEHPEKPSS